MSDLNYDDIMECLDVTVRPDGIDGSGSYKFVCRLEHKGHQSYEQSFGLYFSTDVSIVEVPGDVDAQARGNHVTFRRYNQMSDNGLVEVWIKLSASEQPEVTGITDITCLPEEEGTEVRVLGPVQKAIYERRSIRSYKPDMLSKNLINQIMQAGTYAASGMNRQSSVIIAITDKSVRDRLSALNAKIMGDEESDPFYGAPVVLAVLATYVHDGSLVIGNMMLAAEELGIGSCWVHRAKEEFESEYGRQLLKRLGITGNYEGIGHLVLGYADTEKKSAEPRKENYTYYIE